MIDCHFWARLVLLQFILKVLQIVTPGPSEWLYEYHDKGLNRNDDHWQRLFVT